MEKIIGVLQRWRKNILNYNMEKSEKCYYAVIKNKKCGKFYGTGPIQVAKKVASKKLKSGKEMKFYLDEVIKDILKNKIQNEHLTNYLKHSYRIYT